MSLENHTKDVANHIIKNGLMNQEVTDKVVLAVMAKYAERSATGLKKYGTTLDREDLTLDQWINHLLEELMDATLYLSRIKKEIELHYVKGFSDGYRAAIKQKQKDSIVELMNMDSYEPKECSCYGSNSMHECNCK